MTKTRRPLIHLLLISAACLVLAACGQGALTARPSSASAAAGVLPAHPQVYLEQADPWADKVAEYLRTGVPPLIPKWKGQFELPYLGPILTRHGIVERPGTPHPDLRIGVQAAQGLRVPSKVGLPTPRPASVGTCRHVYLLVAWPGQSQSNTHDPAYEKLFGTNAGHVCPSESDFYSQMSYGKLAVTGDVFPATGAYNISDPADLGELVTSAMNAANPDVDFSQFDGNSDGYIDALSIVLPWDFRAFVSYYWSGPLFDGKHIFTIGFLGESDLAPESRTTHHETGHFFFLPDYYDYGGDGSHPANPGPDGNESAGDGVWELMSAGNFANPPMPMSAYNRWLLNWLEPTVLTGQVNDLVLNPSNLQSNPSETYLLWTEGTYNQEFFLIENRWLDTTTDYGQTLGKGLMVWHVDESLMLNPIGDGVNDIEEHKALDLEEADGQNDLDHMYNYGDATDLYPNSTKEFNFTSNPSSAAYSGDDSQVRIYNIRSNPVDHTVTINVQVSGLRIDLNALPPLVASGTVGIDPNLNGPVERVELYVNGSMVLGADAPPYTYPWDTTGLGDGQATIRGVTFSATENREASQDLVVDNLPYTIALADNAEHGLFQLMPLDAKHPSELIKAKTRQSDGSSTDLAGGGDGTWQTNTDFHTSGTQCFYIGTPGGAYGPFENDFLVSRELDLSAVSNPTLSFSHQFDMEDGKDFAHVFVTSDDGQTLTELATYTGTQTGQRVSLPMPGFEKNGVRVVFFFESDGTGNDGGSAIAGSGWWIDDIIVASGGMGNLPAVSIQTPAAGAVVQNLLDITVAVQANVTRVDYYIYRTGGTTQATADTTPFSKSIGTAALGNQRVLLEARAFNASGAFASDFRELDLYNLLGDANADGGVDATDLDAIRDRIGMTSAAPAYRAWFDCNSDGVVDERDASVVGYNFGSHL